MATAPLTEAYWIHPGLIAGHYPNTEEVRALVAAGVSLFLDLTEAGELPPYDLPEGIEHRRMPIRDFSVPTPEGLERILQTLEGALAAGRTVYVHCHGGIGRTGTVVGCYLVNGGMTGKEALLEIRRLRTEAGCGPDSPETAAQRSLVRFWHPRLNPDAQ